MKLEDIQPIRSDADYQSALACIEKLFGADPNSDEGKILDVLLVLVENWEQQQNYNQLPSDPIAAIKFRMEQKNLSRKDLVPYIGSLSKVSEVLAGKRDLSLSMIRALNQGLDIPADVLINKPLPDVPKELEKICEHAHQFPLKEMKKKGWFNHPNIACYDLKDQAEELIRGWFNLLGDDKSPLKILPRATRQTDKIDKYALYAWCVKVLMDAREIPVNNRYIPCSIDENFFCELRRFSLFVEGPILACNFLKDNGIRLIIEEHLTKTHLDGALLSLNGEPVIGLTLRYDRIDNFWFTLFHELAHLINDFDKDPINTIFTDDMTLNSSSIELDGVEKRADDTARNTLIPDSEWKSEIQKNFSLPTSAKVIELAFKWQVNPAIIAGRLRYEHKNYRLFPDFVGTGEIKPLFKRA